MIAYGYPELIDPKPSTMLMMELQGFRKELKEKHGEWTAANEEAIVIDFVEHLMQLGGGAPEDFMNQFKEAFEGYPDEHNYESMFRIFGQVYDRYAERMMNIESGGAGGRPLPDMEAFLGALQQNADQLTEGFIANIQEFLADPEHQELVSQIPQEFIEVGLLEKIP